MITRDQYFLPKGIDVKLRANDRMKVLSYQSATKGDEKLLHAYQKFSRSQDAIAEVTYQEERVPLPPFKFSVTDN